MENLKILVPLDGSANSNRTVQALIAMKGRMNWPLTLLHVFDSERISFRGFQELSFATVEDRARAVAKQFLEDMKDRFVAEGMHVETLFREGPVRKTICDLADSGEYDFMIIGRQTQGELWHLLFGQVSNYVLHKVKCPVMII